MNHEFNDDHTPPGYLITFRAYGTWLHGDERGSVDQHHRRYDTPILPPSARRKQIEKSLLKQPSVELSRRQIAIINSSIRETCAFARIIFIVLSPQPATQGMFSSL